MTYLLEKASNDSTLGAILSPQALDSPTGHTGLIISERLINMPPQIMPPMYKMLRDEIQWAIDEVWFSLVRKDESEFDLPSLVERTL